MFFYNYHLQKYHPCRKFQLFSDGLFFSCLLLHSLRSTTYTYVLASSGYHQTHSFPTSQIKKAASTASLRVHIQNTQQIFLYHMCAPTYNNGPIDLKDMCTKIHTYTFTHIHTHLICRNSYIFFGSIMHKRCLKLCIRKLCI